MGLKGINWFGNVYQKFEAMCLEVEEIIVQDTAKYVEHQVQTVGNTVKKFCSDVAQDLLLPDDDSPADSEKPLPGSTLHEYAPVCSLYKQKRDVKKEQAEGKKDGFEMNLRGVDADDYDICTSPMQYRYSNGPYRRTKISRKQMSKKEEYVRVISTNDMVTVRCSIDYPTSEVERLVSRDEAQHGLTVVDCVRSQESESRAEEEHMLTVANSVTSQDPEIRTESEHGLTVINSVRSQDAESRPCVATSLPVAIGSQECRKETNEDSMETSSNIIQHDSERSVEESCIFVDRDESHFALPDNFKHKPYKIRDVISSRMKQNREKEYKRLARQWYAEDVENDTECSDINTKQIKENRLTEDEESEWELL